MKSAAILFFFISPLLSYSQLSEHPHGTLVVAVICNDGIVFAADSRSSYTAMDTTIKKEIPYAYLDSVKKIYKLGNFQLAITGNGNVGNRYWEELIDKFNKKHKKDSSIALTFKNFKYFLLKKLKIADSQIKGNTFIMAGYENNTPTIVFTESLNSNDFFQTSKISHRIISLPCIKQDLILGDSQYYCKKIIDFLKGGFTKCSMDSQLGIGGPIHIIIIKPDNTITNVNSFNYKIFKSHYDFEKSIMNGKVKLTYISPHLESQFLNIIRQKQSNPRKYYFSR